MYPFAFAAPRTLEEAFKLLSDSNGVVRPLAGGTDLIDQLRTGRKGADLVMDVKNIPELMRLEWDGKTGLHIGSGVSCAIIYEHAVVKERYPAIAQSTALIGSIQIQNRASVGGNICNAAPSADTVPSLLVCDACAVIGGPRGHREVALEQFFKGPGQTVLAQDELLVEIIVPAPPPRSASHYLRFIPREEMDIAVAGVGSLVALDGRGRCARVRIALAAVAPTPVRAREAEAALEGNRPTAVLVQEVSELAVKATNPITDVRGSVEYRKELVRVLTRRTLTACLKDLGVSI